MRLQHEQEEDEQQQQDDENDEEQQHGQQQQQHDEQQEDDRQCALTGAVLAEQKDRLELGVVHALEGDDTGVSLQLQQGLSIGIAAASHLTAH